MNYQNALIIFIKNLVQGKVKTRLAAKLGDDKAFEIYQMLLAHTFNITNSLNCDKYVFYSDFIEQHDDWSKHGYTQILQRGNSLGKRMQNAFSQLVECNNSFDRNYDRAVIVGSDCAELQSFIIEDAFKALNKVDVVVGPASDGGYYLLGLKKMYEDLFRDIRWSTSTVLNETLAVCAAKGLSVHLLPILNDIDEEDDWIKFLEQQSISHEK